MGTEQDEDLWVVVVCGGTHYYGQVQGIDGHGKIPEPSETSPWVTLTNVCVIEVQMIQTQNGLARGISAYPFCNTLFDTPLHLKPDAIQYLSEMKEADQARYKDIAKKAAAIAEQIRSKDSEILVAGAMPTDGHRT